MNAFVNELKGFKLRKTGSTPLAAQHKAHKPSNELQDVLANAFKRKFGKMRSSEISSPLPNLRSTALPSSPGWDAPRAVPPVPVLQPPYAATRNSTATSAASTAGATTSVASSQPTATHRTPSKLQTQRSLEPSSPEGFGSDACSGLDATARLNMARRPSNPTPPAERINYSRPITPGRQKKLAGLAGRMTQDAALQSDNEAAVGATAARDSMELREEQRMRAQNLLLRNERECGEESAVQPDSHRVARRRTARRLAHVDKSVQASEVPLRSSSHGQSRWSAFTVEPSSAGSATTEFDRNERSSTRIRHRKPPSTSLNRLSYVFDHDTAASLLGQTSAPKSRFSEATVEADSTRTSVQSVLSMCDTNIDRHALLPSPRKRQRRNAGEWDGWDLARAEEGDGGA